MGNLSTSVVAGSTTGHAADHNTLHAFHNLIDAKGDLIAGTGVDTAGKVTVGTNGHVLTADSTAAAGVAWAAPTGGIPATLLDAKGDLIVATAADTAARLAAGTDGHVLTADSTQAAGVKWAAAASGGGSVAHKMTVRTGGNYTTTSTSFVAIDGTNLSLTLTAAVGDIIYASLQGIAGNENITGRVDFATIVAGAIVNQFSGSAYGMPGLVLEANLYSRPAAVVPYTVQSGDLSSGSVTVRPIWKVGTPGSASTKTLYATADNPLHFYVQNLGPTA